MSSCGFINQVEEKRTYVRFCQAFYWFRMELNKFNSTRTQNIRFYLWYETKIILKYFLVWKHYYFAKYI